MARQYLIPGGIYINETGTYDYLIPTSVYVNESAGAGGNLIVSVSDTISLSDAVLGSWGFVKSDTVNLSESLSGSYALLISDTLSLSDAIAFFVASTALTQAVSDSFNFLDSIRGAYSLIPNESLNFSDNTNRSAVYSIILPDSETLSDATTINLQPFVASKIPYHHLYAGLNDLV